MIVTHILKQQMNCDCKEFSKPSTLNSIFQMIGRKKQATRHIQ